MTMKWKKSQGKKKDIHIHSIRNDGGLATQERILSCVLTWESGVTCIN